jgi:hypothetical protein
MRWHVWVCMDERAACVAGLTYLGAILFTPETRDGRFWLGGACFEESKGRRCGWHRCVIGCGSSSVLGGMVS